MSRSVPLRRGLGRTEVYLMQMSATRSSQRRIAMAAGSRRRAPVNTVHAGCRPAALSPAERGDERLLGFGRHASQGHLIVLLGRPAHVGVRTDPVRSAAAHAPLRPQQHRRAHARRGPLDLPLPLASVVIVLARALDPGPRHVINACRGCDRLARSPPCLPGAHGVSGQHTAVRLEAASRGSAGAGCRAAQQGMVARRAHPPCASRTRRCPRSAATAPGRAACPSVPACEARGRVEPLEAWWRKFLEKRLVAPTNTARTWRWAACPGGGAGAC
jgi:hypothetical protein